MNERIKEIMGDATLDADSYFDRDCAAWRQIYNEKFAELIIQECISILMKPEYAMNHPEQLSDYNRGWVNGRLLGIEHIKQHFGVEK